MEVKERSRKQWLGGLGSIGLQALIFFSALHFFGDFIAALTILSINLILADSHRNTNPYLQGARWATFLNLSWASYARHSYWYQDTLASFERLRDFNNPVGWNQVFCQGTLEEIFFTGVTSAMLVGFYYLVAQWPEWTERWELVRRGFFSASLGLQMVIFVTVLYPTVTTMATALFFASVISPILRRQVRINHIVFMALVTLFSLGCPPVAIFYSLVTGYFFLYFVSSERSLSARNATFSFFSGIVTLALFISLVQNQLVDNISGAFEAIATVGAWALTVALGYWLALDVEASARIRRAQMRFTPKFLVIHPWWAMRSLWVDREVTHRLEGLYNRKEMEPKLSLFLFGPREWRDNGAEPARASHQAPSVILAIAVLPFFAMFLWIEAAIDLAVGNRGLTVGTLALGFLIILGIPSVVMWKHFTKRKIYAKVGIIATVFAWGILGLFMGVIVYFGLTSSNALQNVSTNDGDTTTSQPNMQNKPAECACSRSQLGKSSASP